MDWGTVPAWIAAVFTSISAMVAAGVYVGAERRRVRAGARRVLVKVEALEPPVGQSQLRYRLTVRNLGDDPVLQLRMTVHAYGSSGYHEGLVGDEIDLEPGETAGFISKPLAVKEGQSDYHSKSYPVLYGEVSFTDVNGFLWRKFSNSRLESQYTTKGVHSPGYRWRKRLIPASLRRVTRERYRIWRRLHLLTKVGK